MGVTSNLVISCKSYYRSLGVDEVSLSTILDSSQFSKGLTIPLAPVNVLKENRPEHNSSKQTHIHVTGESMEFFYSKSFLNNVNYSTEDQTIKVNLINANINHLEMIIGSRRSSIEYPQYTYPGTLLLLESSTVKKVGHKGTQVQLSKTRKDGSDFRRLRNGLFPNDLLVFLEYKDKSKGYLVMGLPSSFVATTPLQYESSPLFTSIDEEEIISDFRITLRGIAADSIAQYDFKGLNGEYESSTSLVDLSGAINTRSKRTERHQKLLKKLAVYLEENGFSLYEGNIDCLAFKEGVDTLVIEAKTLDGTSTDESNQVRLAIGQLIYYEALATKEFEETSKLKIAYFEKEIAEHHIKLLRQTEIYVLWVNELNEIDGETESIEFITSLCIH